MHAVSRPPLYARTTFFFDIASFLTPAVTSRSPRSSSCAAFAKYSRIPAIRSFAARPLGRDRLDVLEAASAGRECSRTSSTMCSSLQKTTSISPLTSWNIAGSIAP